jgi:hypothetical protein
VKTISDDFLLLKVRDLKAAREREQEAAKETIEELKMKQQREKTQEMTVCL